MRFVDKITKSKYFQKATETEFIKKKIEEVSNTPLLLTVEVQECKGTLTVNIPPPPTDRIWYVEGPGDHCDLPCCVTIKIPACLPLTLWKVSSPGQKHFQTFFMEHTLL